MAHSRFFERVLSWANRHQRWLSALFFIFGFAHHIITFGVFSLHTEILIFEAYLAWAALCTVVAHMTAGKEGGKVLRTIAVAAPLLAQLTIGGLLAGFVVFYTKSSALTVSWPFLILLAVIFFGNELFRDLRDRLIFQIVLLYFSAYAFFIFALPTFLGRIGRTVFLESTAVSLGVLAVFLLLLALLQWRRLKRELLPVIASCIVLTGVIVGAYLTHIVPPIPLTLKEGDIFHSVTRVNGDYVAQGEAEHAWWDIRPVVVHHVAGEPLYAYSSIFAPTAFSTGVVHRWQWYDPQAKKWTDQAVIAFTVSGGREAGYRGYSMKADPQPGEWRVRVETLEGQIIGQMRFTVQNVASEPVLDKYAK